MGDGGSRASDLGEADVIVLCEQGGTVGAFLHDDGVTTLGKRREASGYGRGGGGGGGGDLGTVVAAGCGAGMMMMMKEEEGRRRGRKKKNIFKGRKVWLWRW